MTVFFKNIKEYVDGVSGAKKQYEQEALEKKRSDLAEKIEEIKTKEPMFLVVKNGLKNTIILFFNIKNHYSY